MPKRPLPADPSLVVGYVRVSTDDQALSPDAQREAMARWCATTGRVLVATHEDIGVSGGSALDDRPGLMAALADVAERKAGVLLVIRRDRLARDPMVAAMVEAAAARSGARVASVAGEGTESNDPTSMLMRRIVDAFAEYERLLIRARTKSAMAVLKSRGQTTGVPPIGSQTGDDGRALVPDESERAAIARARELRASGASIRGIAAALQAEGVPCRGGRWHATTVARILGRNS